MQALPAQGQSVVESTQVSWLVWQKKPSKPPQYPPMLGAQYPWAPQSESTRQLPETHSLPRIEFPPPTFSPQTQALPLGQSESTRHWSTVHS
jgi:hypothetical protein